TRPRPDRDTPRHLGSPGVHLRSAERRRRGLAGTRVLILPRARSRSPSRRGAAKRSPALEWSRSSVAFASSVLPFDVRWPCSANNLSGPTIAIRPVGARGALLSLRVVDAFCVGASNDSGTQHDSLDVVGGHELEGSAADLLIEPNIGLGG